MPFLPPNQQHQSTEGTSGGRKPEEELACQGLLGNGPLNGRGGN